MTKFNMKVHRLKLNTVKNRETRLIFNLIFPLHKYLI